MELALLTPSDEHLGVLVHRWPEESALPNFGLSAECSVVASIRSCMVLCDDLYTLRRGHAPSQQAIGTYPVEVRIVPKVTSAFSL